MTDLSCAPILVVVTRLCMCVKAHNTVHAKSVLFSKRKYFFAKKGRGLALALR